MDEGRLTKNIFNMDLDLCKMNWSSEMKNIFQKLDMIDIFNNRQVCDTTAVKSKLYEIMELEWRKDVIKKPKLRTYVTFKDSFATEDYVRSNISRSARSLLAQFRIGILPIKVETGRFKNLAVSERICEVCSLNMVEDEKHFLCVCPIYDRQRLILYEKANALCPQFPNMSIDDKFIFIVKNMWRAMSVYLMSSWKIRQNKLYQ